MGIPGGYSESSGPDFHPAVTTCWPTETGARRGRYWSSSWFGLPTAGTSTPLSPYWSWTWAVTAEEWSVIRVTMREVAPTLETRPTRAPSPTTGSLTCTPSSEPLSTSIVEYQRVGSREITWAATGW